MTDVGWQDDTIDDLNAEAARVEAMRDAEPDHWAQLSLKQRLLQIAVDIRNLRAGAT